MHHSSLEVDSDQSEACLYGLWVFGLNGWDVYHRSSKSAFGANKNRPTETDISYDGLTNIVDVTRA